MHSGRPKDHAGPAAYFQGPEEGLGDEHNLQDRQDKVCRGCRIWIGRLVVGPVEGVGECILGEDTDRIEEVGGNLAGRGSGVLFLGMAGRKPGFGTDMPWDYKRHPPVHLRHTDRSLELMEDDASA